MGLLLQLRWLRRIKLRSFLEVWRGLAVGLLGLLLSAFLLLLARRTVLVSGLLLAFVVGRLRRPLVLVLESVGGTAGWLPALVAVGLANLRCIRQYHAAIHSGAGH